MMQKLCALHRISRSFFFICFFCFWFERQNTTRVAAFGMPRDSIYVSHGSQFSWKNVLRWEWAMCCGHDIPRKLFLRSRVRPFSLSPSTASDPNTTNTMNTLHESERKERWTAKDKKETNFTFHSLVNCELHSNQPSSESVNLLLFLGIFRGVPRRARISEIFSHWSSLIRPDLEAAAFKASPDGPIPTHICITGGSINCRDHQTLWTEGRDDLPTKKANFFFSADVWFVASMTRLDVLELHKKSITTAVKAKLTFWVVEGRSSITKSSF